MLAKGRGWALAAVLLLGGCGASNTKQWTCACATSCQNIDLSTRRFPVCARESLAAEAERSAKADCDADLPQECLAVEFRTCTCTCTKTQDNC